MASSLGYEAGNLDGFKPSSSSGGVSRSSHRTAASFRDTPFAQVSAGRDMATKIMSRDNYCTNYIDQRCKEPGEVSSASVVRSCRSRQTRTETTCA
jgi:hypothetical protein